MHLIAKAKFGLPLPSSLPAELTASAGHSVRAAPEAANATNAGWGDDDFGGLSDFSGVQQTNGAVNAAFDDDDFGDFGQFQEPASAPARPPALSMNFMGAPVAASQNAQVCRVSASSTYYALLCIF
jgi:hypothetical protein